MHESVCGPSLAARRRMVEEIGRREAKHYGHVGEAQAGDGNDFQPTPRKQDPTAYLCLAFLAEGKTYGGPLNERDAAELTRYLLAQQAPPKPPRRVVLVAAE